jgi:protein-S-isoprenylcysteine O-methyltransferase Ste14
MTTMTKYFLTWLVVALAACVSNMVLLSLPTLILNGSSRWLTDGRLFSTLLLIGSWTFCEAFAGRGSHHPPQKGHGPSWLTPLIGLVLLALLLTSFIECALRPSIALGPAETVEIVLMAIGILLRIWSIESLGPCFFNEVIHVPDQPLIDRGPYRLFRHPSEVGLFCVVLGAALLLRSLVGTLAAVAVLLPLIIWRTRLEDAMLAHHHQAEFRRYQSRVGGLLPKLNGRRQSLDT